MKTETKHIKPDFDLDKMKETISNIGYEDALETIHAWILCGLSVEDFIELIDHNKEGFD